MVMNPSCCINTQDNLVRDICFSIGPILSSMDLRARLRLINALMNIHPMFRLLMDYQLQEPPNPD
jgi:hypothetical protein